MMGLNALWAYDYDKSDKSLPIHRFVESIFQSLVGPHLEIHHHAYDEASKVKGMRRQQSNRT